jgi:AcrR family transcriptional regulator
MYDQVDEQGRNKFTVAQIAAEFSVTRPTIYRYLDQDA